MYSQIGWFRMVVKVCVFVLLAGLSQAADGLPPRDTPADYPVHQATADNTAIAAVWPARDVMKNSFLADLSRDWVIVEVAVYPGDAAVKVKPGEFQLQVHERDTVSIMHAVRPDEVAAATHPPREPVQFGQTHGSVGYETTVGGNIHEQRVGGAIESGGDQPPPPPVRPGSDELERLLSARCLPSGVARAPVAGYLYFPRRFKKRSKLGYELKYTSQAGSITLELPAEPR